MRWLLIVIGFLSGIISGMGVGGGTLLIPALTIFMHVEQKAAQSINLLYFIPTATVALWIHAKNKRIQWRVLGVLVVSGVVGALGGSFLASYVEGSFLKKIFGVFLFIMGVIEFFKKGKKDL
ncbi:MAG: sulfite exporter TauE/SafE family protein [Epulopiscium sp.]|nr:sulfite exporter TauE/SafE family protein [Candidatus Epulonipiscium sp.]